MEEVEYNDIVTYIQDQKYPQNAIARRNSAWYRHVNMMDDITGDCKFCEAML
jgi:hypothetical protein